jgi:hypothetical protein
MRPPTMPPTMSIQGLPDLNAKSAANQVPRIIWPSSPMLTTPDRSDQRPPRPASMIGMAELMAAPIAPPVVRFCSSLMIRVRLIAASPSRAARMSRVALRFTASIRRSAGSGASVETAAEASRTVMAGPPSPARDSS